jgi:hypothetical protein
MLATLLSILLTTAIYFLLSTLHIYLIPSTPTVTSAYTENSYPPTHGSSELLFRVGHLHIYGIRALFMTIVVGGSISVMLVFAYIALALRKRVERDVSEEWREQEGGPGQTRVIGPDDENGAESRWWRRRHTRHSTITQFPRLSQSTVAVPDRVMKRDTTTSIARRRSFMPSLVPSSGYSGSAGRSSRRLSRKLPVVRVTPPKRLSNAPKAVPFIRGEARARNLRLLEQLAVEDQQRKLESCAWPTAPDTASRYEIPSYYFQDHDSNRTSASTESSRPPSSSGIPSYYFKMHDADGNSIQLDAQQPDGGDVKEPGPATRPDIVRQPSPLRRELQATHGRESVRSPCASLTGSTALSDSGRRRTVLSGSTGGESAISNRGHASGGQYLKSDHDAY